MANILTNYLKESKAELTKVAWPTREQAIQATLLVIVVSIFATAFLGGVDYLLNLGLQFILAN